VRLDALEVAYLLHNLGLEAYVESFLRRGVNGVDLLECRDEDLLQLGIDFR
jgi:hypothetical protein